jgi:hypothetical protein
LCEFLEEDLVLVGLGLLQIEMGNQLLLKIIFRLLLLTSRSKTALLQFLRVKKILGSMSFS